MFLSFAGRRFLPDRESSEEFLRPSRLDAQPIVHPARAALAVGILLSTTVASILGLPVYLAVLSGAILVILTRLVDPDQAYRAIPWRTLLTIAGMYPASLAIVQTGLAHSLSHFLLSLVTPLGPYGLAAGAYWLTAALTQVLGGQITILVTGPITIQAAIQTHTDPHAIAVASAIACSASFFTPLAHPVNLMMIAPAGYEFRDFFHIGWRLTLVCFLVLMLGMFLFWRL